MSQRQFHPLDVNAFKLLVEKFDFRRKIDAVHLHHTWRPNHAQYRGHDTILAMWRFHTQDQGWSDIAQHVTIAPDGTIWTGRDWNRSPASASGFNGNASVGPFMIEMIGDFDRGKDRFEGAQKTAALEVIAAIQANFDLPEKSLRFHNSMSSKTCPGSAIVYDDLIKELKQIRSQAKSAAPAGARAVRPFDDRMLEIQRVIDAMSNGGVRAADPADAEVPEPGPGDERERLADLFEAGGEREAERGQARGIQITPRMLADLAPHMVNLSQGRFSRAGRVTTDPGDVDAIFEQHLVAELEVARREKRPLRLVFFAHGGLVSEESGISVAHKHVSWWKANGVYPIYFTWETGLVETLRSFLPFGGQRNLPGAERGFSAREILDRGLERLVHLPGEKVWGGMKRSAERSVDPIPGAPGQPRPLEGGGARYAAEKLVELLGRPEAAGVPVELHAVGHSAGSIFHSWFVPAALDLGAPRFTSAHFLAPAITVDGFLERLDGRLGNGIDHLTLYTMKKALELDDTCGPYHKSLLYLIYFALEPRREEAILGLEESLRGNRRLKERFGLDGRTSPVGEVVWSESPSETGLSASRSTTHGGFDDDVPTMDSVLRRVLDVNDSAAIQSYAKFQSAGRGPAEADPWTAPSEREAELRSLLQPFTENGSSVPPPTPFAASEPVGSAFSSASPFNGSTAHGAGNGAGGNGGGGRRRALCVGIDRYPTAPLGGCVADARLWSQTLAGLGFESPAMLLDEQATRSAILDSLGRLIGEGRPGDVLVFQFAGHGTQVADLDEDEKEDAQDEAFCPIDFATGAFLIDDDIAQVFSHIPDGLNVTCFIDCCHSGTITRLAAGRQGLPPDPTARARFLKATPAMEQAHAAFRSKRGLRGTGSRSVEQMREVTFSACQSFQVAMESQGQGEFTRRATRILSAGIQGMTHEAFQQRVEAAFEPGGQKPFLHCVDGVRRSGLLQPFSGALGGGRSLNGGGDASRQGPVVPCSNDAMADLLRSLARMVAPGA
ncbi:MAG TPA: caspase family protein [Thermoanaerobaculia bacterium]|nr:caspase family protein [Thermoanaerobaculia bacterium]